MQILKLTLPFRFRLKHKTNLLKLINNFNHSIHIKHSEGTYI